MAIGDSYITTAQLAAYLGIPLTQTDSSRDAKLAAAVSSASKSVEGHCRRQFNTDGVVSARVYEPTSAHLAVVEDFYDTTTLVVAKKQLAASTWTTIDPTNFELEPRNGVVNGQPGWPYRRVKLPYWFYFWGVDRVQVTAKWGWPAVPASVVQATYIIAAQYYKLPDAPFGVAGFGSGSDGFSAVKVSDVPQAWSILCPYVLNPITVG